MGFRVLFNKLLANSSHAPKSIEVANIKALEVWNNLVGHYQQMNPSLREFVCGCKQQWYVRQTSDDEDVFILVKEGALISLWIFNDINQCI